MPIFFKSLLEQYGLSPRSVRLLRHKDQRAERGKTPYELWLDDPKQFDKYQAIQQPRRRKQLNADYWASFVGLKGNQTLFVGLFRVKYKGPSTEDTPKVYMAGTEPAGSRDTYKLILDNKLREFVGKLFISWGKNYRAWIQYADQQDKAILELRPELKEPDFPGFLMFISNLSKIKNDKLPKGWRDILEISRGVYLLTCPKTKEQYVGMATGEGGFWSRWREHAKNERGDAIKLKSREPSDYQVSILEVVGTSTTDEEIIDLEKRWKDKLRTRDMGLNGN